MRGRSLSSVVFTIAVASLTLTGCDDAVTTSESPDLSGSYELESITFEGQPTLEPPAASGTLQLTDTTYDVDIEIQTQQGTQQIMDNGTYSISGDTWTQESNVTDVQSTGTFDFDGTFLTVSVETQGQQVQNVWRKTG